MSGQTNSGSACFGHGGARCWLILVGVDNLDGSGPVVCPFEADAILVVDPYRVLALAISFQCLQVVARRHTELCQIVHDKFRITPSGGGSYERILAGLAELRRREIPFQLVAVVNVETAPRLGATVAELTELGAQRVTLAPNFRDDWTDATIDDLRQGLADAAEHWIGMFRAGRQLPIDPLHTKILTHLKGGIPCPSRCLIAGHELCVSPAGKIYPCAQMVQENQNDHLAIGTVDEGLDSSRVKALQQLKDRVEQTCAPCALRDRCQSHCGCRHLALSGQLGEITATLCETEAAFIDAADQIAETRFEEQNPAFVDYYYLRPWTASTGGVLTPLRRARDA